MALWVYENKIEELAAFLNKKNCTVNIDKVGYRTIMFNKDNKQHTQGYANSGGVYIKFTGPETNLVQEFIDGQK